MFGYVFYRQFQYKMVTHARVFSLKFNEGISNRQGIFISNSLKYLYKLFGYENMCSWDKIKELKIKLPIYNNKIYFEFMNTFIEELEALRIEELEAYLSITGLNNYNLTVEEINVINNFDKLNWCEFNLSKLYGKASRGKRLKSEDRVKGILPFVTAGEANEGISDFIGNDVEVYSSNTTTIDMFGSAKYRNYKYGGDDHIAVVHTECLEKYAAIFVTTAINKSSHNGQFSYDKNFYAKDADALNIQLPSINNEPDYNTMSLIISAIHKMVIEDVVRYTDNKINSTKEVIKC